ncbi:DUF4433 domain-containing protein [Providencia vermicola]|uniref:DUF4433 domain-containing protein n=2 Tax=Providencia TaxID=586 RepID=A0ABD5L9X5_PROST|nr:MULTISPECIES: DUF4433 domain-containing protein [Providencia]ELR5045886.1 DUF4433 domain-containing protein [Providencia rettgeri]ELR5144027.1 DUF4433 domain-containing protein [Providencia stuartii]ELR5293070.1 DUF4433 domain-containing protein [Providencia stuartii]ELX8380031.1 DUF4433 domain-containing protein [Providencia stuartii]EMD5259420.1 DUF4433 domain-containing protein [Providencia stuartii]
MAYMNLNPEKALIWRITHRQNIPWLFANGLYAGNSEHYSPNWVTIGNTDLINRRNQRHVPIQPNGVLNDYVPFYFTPFSPMMYNIYTGRGGVRKVPNDDIIILVSSMYKIAALKIPFVFTDRHAYPVTSQFYNQLTDLAEIDWALLQQRNFHRDPDDPEKVERYQAEALIYKHVPMEALLGAVCYTKETQLELQAKASQLEIHLDIHCIPNWYF